MKFEQNRTLLKGLIFLFKA